MFEPEGLRAENISKRYGSLEALHKVSLEWKRGEITTVLGPSGSGKTTLGEIFAGLVRPEEGRIYRGQEDITGWRPNRRRIALMPQEWELFPHLTALENVGFGLWASGVGKRDLNKRASDLLEVIGLAERKDALPQELSGGQQQRVALARALATPSPFVVLDEPLTSVDQDTRKSLRNYLLEESHRDRGILLITHDRGDALMLSQTIHCFLEGQLIMTGSPQDVYYAPVSLSAAMLTGEAFLIPLTVGGCFDETPPSRRGDVQRQPLPLRETPGERSENWFAIARPEWLRVTHNGQYHLLGQVSSSRYLGRQFLVTLTDGPNAAYQAYSDCEFPRGASVRLSIKQGIQLPVVSKEEER